MAKIIAGVKGTGKTKKLLDMLNEAIKATHGDVVCIEKGMQATYHISSSVRIIDIDEYKIDSYEKLELFNIKVFL